MYTYTYKYTYIHIHINIHIYTYMYIYIRYLRIIIRHRPLSTTSSSARTRVRESVCGWAYVCVPPPHSNRTLSSLPAPPPLYPPPINCLHHCIHHACYTRVNKSRTTHTNDSYHLYVIHEWVISHIWMSRLTHMLYTCEIVMPVWPHICHTCISAIHVWMSHEPHIQISHLIHMLYTYE